MCIRVSAGSWRRNEFVARTLAKTRSWHGPHDCILYFESDGSRLVSKHHGRPQDICYSTCDNLRVWEECIGIEKTQNVHEEYNVANSTNGTCVAPRSLWHGHWRGWGNCKICKTPSPENGTWTHLSNGEWKEHFIFNPCSHPKLIFSPENAGNSVLESQIFKIFRGSMPPDPPSRLAPSALTLLETGHIFSWIRPWVLHVRLLLWGRSDFYRTAESPVVYTPRIRSQKSRLNRSKNRH